MYIKRFIKKRQNKNISKSLAAFGFGQIQDAMQIIAVIKGKDIGIDRFMEWGHWMKTPGHTAVHRQTNTDKTNKIYTCPSCGLPLLLISVNSAPCNIVGGEYNSLFYCYDEIFCGYELYSNKTLDYWESISDDMHAWFIRNSINYTGGLDNDPSPAVNKLKSHKCGGCGSK